LESIVVSGIGAVSSLGSSIDEIWSNLLIKKSGIKEISRFDPHDYKTKIAAEINNFEPCEIIRKKDLHKMDKLSLYALSAVNEAINQSGLNNNINISSERIGLFWSSGNGGIESTEQGVKLIGITNKYPVFQQIKILNDAPVGWIAQYFNIKGVNMSVTAACSSSIVALQTAQVYINAGICDFAIVGGSEAPITPTVIAGFSAMGALSKNNHSPRNAARAFSKLRDGFVVGEGAAAIVIGLESETNKQKMKALAKLNACYNSNDAQDFVHPNEIGIYNNIINCLKKSQLKNTDISAIFPHATSTLLGDKAEYTALKNIFNHTLKDVYLMCIKNYLGHLLGASGAIAAVLAIKCIEMQQVIPNTLNTDEKEYEELKLNFENDTAALNHILCITSGLGGHHAACIFSKITHSYTKN
jgi:3-oxoacyl-[acyl-carrier-protein] synthase II